MQKEFRNKQSDQGSICHCEQSRAIHKTRNPHVISRLTGNPGNKDFNASWMPDRVGHDSGVVSQSGRSMVEMLGTLAIVGVLSAGAIGGYSYAMNKHRTNELIYEATKRAQWVGTQLEMNKNAQNIGFGGFETDTFGGGKFTGTVKTDLANPNQFGIVVSALKEAVCENIQNSIAENTVIRAIKDSTGTGDITCDEGVSATLVFNRDLSTSDSEVPSVEPEVSGEVSAQASTEVESTATEVSDRKLYCNDHGEWDGNSCDCDAGYEGETCSVEINAQPDEPEEPTINCGYHGEQVGSVCECDYGWTGDACSEIDDDKTCSGNGTWLVSTGTPNGGYCACNFGYYGAKCSEQTLTSCTANSDCDEGYYCKYTSGVTCTGKDNATGQCIKISDHRGGNKDGFTWSNTDMDWFSAENFCAAQNKDMPTIDSFECYKDGTSTVFTNGMAYSYDYCCVANGTTCNYNDWAAGGETRSNKFASKIVSLKSTVGGDQGFWTQSLTNVFCYAFGVGLSDGAVNYNGRNNGYYALCR